MKINDKCKNLLEKYHYDIPKSEEQLESLIEELQNDFINYGINDDDSDNKQGDDIDYLIDILSELLEEWKT